MASLQSLTVVNNSVLPTVDINGGTIDGVAIGNDAANRTTIAGTTITADTKFVGDIDGNLNGTIGGVTPNTGAFSNVTTSGSLVVGTTLTATGGTSTFSAVDINSGTMDGVNIGGSTQGTILATSIGGTTITASVGFSGNITGPTGGTVGTSTLNDLDLNGDLTLNSGSLIFGATTVIDASRNATLNDLTVNGSFTQSTMNVTNDGAIGGNLVITGDLTVNGTNTVLNTQSINLEDNTIVLNNGGVAQNSGLQIARGGNAPVLLLWDETNGYWTVGNEDFVATNFIGNLTGNVTGDITGDILGNAATASELETARTISLSGDVAGSISFDGSANVDISTTIQANSVALGTDTTGQYTTTMAVSGIGLSINPATPNADDGTAYTITSNATANDTVSTIVARDTSGDFSARNITATSFIGNVNSTAGADLLNNLTVGGTLTVTGTTTFNNGVTVATGQTFGSDSVAITGGTILGTNIGNAIGGAASVIGSTVTAINGFTGDITGDVTGNADTATALSSAVTVQLTGDVTGSATFTSAGDTASIVTTVGGGVIALGTNTTGQYASTIATSGNGIGVTTPNANDGTAYTITSNATALGTAETIVFRDVNGNFSATTITADLTGDVAGNVTGNLTGNVTAATGTSTFNTVDIADLTATTADINGGNIDNTVIGNTSRAAGNFTTVNANDVITATAGVDGDLTGNVTATTGTSNFTNLAASGTLDVTGLATFGDVEIGGDITFETLDVTGSLTIGTDLDVLGQVRFADEFIRLNSDLANTVNATQNVGFIINRGIDDDVRFMWDETNNRWSTDEEALAATGGLFGPLNGTVGATTPSTGNFTTITTDGNVTVGNDLLVSGDLTVSGSVSTVNTEEIRLADNIIRVNSNATVGASGGIEVWRGADGAKQFIWNEGDARWSTEDEDFQAGTAYADFVGNVTVGTGKTLNVSAGTLTLADNQISGNKINGGTIDAITIDDLTATTVDINAGTIDNAILGATTPVTITANTIGGTTISASNEFQGDLVGNVTGNVTGNITAATGTSAFTNITASGTTTLSGDLTVNAGTTTTVQDLVINGTTNFNAFSITGNLTVGGEVSFDDTFIVLNATGGTQDSGITVARSAGSRSFYWDEVNDQWTTNSAPLAAGILTGEIGTNNRNAGYFTTINANAGITGSFDGPVTSNSVTITGGTINGTVIGASVPANITGSNISATGNITANTGEVTAATITATTNFIGPITGNVTGNVTGDVTGDLIGNADTATALFTPRTIAGQTFDGTANITIAATDLSDTNQSLSTSDNVTFNDVNVDGDLTVAGTIDVPNLTITGNLTVNGTTTTLNTETVRIADSIILLNSDYSGSSPTESAGIEVNRGGGTETNRSLIWDESINKWTVGGATFVANNFEGPLTGNVTGFVTSTSGTNTFATVDIGGGFIDNTTIGSTTAAEGTFSDLTVNTTFTTATAQINGNLTATGNISGNLLASALSNRTTTDLAEGSNLYYLDSRVNSHLDATNTAIDNGVDYSNGVISIGQPVGTTDDVVFNDVTVNGILTADNYAFTNITASGFITVAGNLTANGTTTTLNSAVDITDPIITVNSGFTGSNPSAGDYGIVINRDQGGDKKFVYTEEAGGSGFWTTKGATLVAGAFEGSITGDINSTGTSNLAVVDIDGGSIDGTAIGNAVPSTGRFSSVTADTVTIDGGNINGTAIGSTTTASGSFTSVTADTVNLDGGSIDGTTIGGAVPAGGSFTSVTADSVNLDGGNIDGTTIGLSNRAPGYFTTIAANDTITASAGITGNLTGNVTGLADRATRLETARTIILDGDVAGNASFNGTADITITTAIQPNSIQLGTDTNGQYAAEITGVGNGLDITAPNAQDGTDYTITINSTTNPTGNTLVFRDATGDFSANEITSDLIGNVTAITGTSTFNNIDINGTVSDFNTGTITGDLSGNVTATSGTSTFTNLTVNGTFQAQTQSVTDLVVEGNLTVQGSQTIIQSETIELYDQFILLNSNATEDQDAGIQVYRGGAPLDSVQFKWDSVNDRWTSGSANIATDGNFVGTLAGNVNTSLGNSIFNDITAAGTTTLATVDINSGDIDGTVIGDNVPANGTFDTLTASTFNINGGSINGVNIGQTTAGQGTFTNLSADDVNLDGGSIDDTVIGAGTANSGRFTDVTVINGLTVGTTISATGNISTDGTFIGNLSGDGTNITGLSTTQISEGTKKFFTQAAAENALLAISVGQHSDVDLTTSAPADGQVLVWNQGLTKFEPKDIFSTSSYSAAIATTDIGDLANVDTSGLVDGDTLVYNSTSGNFEPAGSQETPTSTFTVIPTGTTSWTFSGAGTDSDNNPTLYLVPGQTYKFDINATGTPFYINTTSGTGTSNAYNDGVNNNGTDSGTITFTVPQDAPNQLFYNASNQATMAGIINIVNGSGTGSSGGGSGDVTFDSVTATIKDPSGRTLLIKDSSGNVVWGD